MKKIFLLLLIGSISYIQAIACGEGGCSSTIVSNFNSTPIASHNKIWFSAVLKIERFTTYPVTIYFKSQTITTPAFTLSVPDGELILDPSVTTATTVFDGTKWITTAKPAMSGNYFISGYCDSLTSGLAGGLWPVSWSGQFFASNPGVSIRWQWTAAVYTSFSDPGEVGVKPSDCSGCSSYVNTDYAGTPEFYKAHVTGGARGTGGSNYTGSYSAAGLVVACTCPTPPRIAAITGEPVMCEGASITLSELTTGGTWSSSNMSKATVSSHGVVTAIDWGTVTISYSVPGGCSASIATKSITINPLPAIMPVTGGGSYCVGGSGVPVTLPGSAVGVNYQLYRYGSAIGSPVPGAGCGITLGVETVPGTYTVVATNAATGCTSNMSGDATVSVVPLPNVYTVMGGGSYCYDGAGADVQLSGSDAGVNYKVFVNGILLDTIYAGIGSALDFGLQTDSGLYTVTAIDAVAGCTAAMSGSAAVYINPLPYAGAICGPSTVHTGSSITLVDSSAGGIWISSDSTIVAVCPATGICTGISEGFVNVTYTVTNLCGEAQTTFTVHGLGGHDGSRMASGGHTATGNSLASEKVQVFPNPSNGAFRLQATEVAGNEVLVSISDLAGQTVYSGRFVPANGVVDEQLQLGKDIADGIYVLTLHAGNEDHVFRLAVSR